MTTKVSPVSPSNFAGNIFSPLTQFLQKARPKESLSASISHAVVAAVFQRFEAMRANITEQFLAAQSIMKKFEKAEDAGSSGRAQSDY